jgi:hypothetical protein
MEERELSEVVQKVRCALRKVESQFLSAVGQTPGQKHSQSIAMAGSAMSQNASPSNQPKVIKKLPRPTLPHFSMWGVAILYSSSSFVEKNVKLDRFPVFYS